MASAGLVDLGLARIAPCPWFDDQAEGAVAFYTAIFGNFKDREGGSLRRGRPLFPGALVEMITDPDSAKSGRVMEAMLRMKKIDIDAVKRAYAG